MKLLDNALHIPENFRILILQIQRSFPILPLTLKGPFKGCTVNTQIIININRHDYHH